ncbi:major facilitator transporter [Caballeronia peredens]|nr:major facilitator transporter [Caballeronia peredens]
MFLVTVVILPIRGALFAHTTSPYAVIAFQFLNGIAAAICGVVAVVIVSDLIQGIRRFNLAQGLMALSVGAGAPLSNVAGAFVVQRCGYATRPPTLEAIALAFFALAMPEASWPGSEKSVSGDNEHCPIFVQHDIVGENVCASQAL